MLEPYLRHPPAVSLSLSLNVGFDSDELRRHRCGLAHGSLSIDHQELLKALQVSINTPLFDSMASFSLNPFPFVFLYSSGN